MDLKTRVGRLEAEIGVDPAEPLPLKTIFVFFDDPGVLDEHGNRTGAGPGDSHSATVWTDLCERHFKRAAGEMFDDFKHRLARIPWGVKNPVKVVLFWPDKDVEPVERRAAKTLSTASA